MTNETLPLIVTQNPGVAVTGGNTYFLARQTNSATPTMDSGVSDTQVAAYVTSAFSNQGQIIRLASGVSINAFTVANTPLYTVPTGKTLVVTAAIVKITAASAVTAGPTIGFGNVAGTSNIYAAQATGSTFNTAGTIFNFPIAGGISVVTAAAGVVYANLTVAATGTSETLAIDLYGYLY